MNGIIIKGIGGFYYVKTADNKIYECKARGIFRKDGIKPIVGDRVEFMGGSISKIEERKNSLIRPAVANIDVLVIVIAALSPDPDLFLIDKMTVNALINGITPIICINKTDLAKREDISDIYTKAGFDTVSVSAERNTGIDALAELIKDKTAAFTGLSGVGKSSILNIITKNEMETGAVSEKIQRGRHTTRHVELLELKLGGFAFDTPGFGSLEINTIPPEELELYFPETEQVRGECRFRGCMHINEPDCAVKALVESGKMPVSRYESYKILYDTLRRVKQWEK